MPAILSRPLRRDPLPEQAPLELEPAQQERIALHAAYVHSVRIRRAAGVVCAVLALLLAGLGLAPFAASTVAVAQVSRQAVLATGADLVHRALLRPEDTASTQGTAEASGAASGTGKPNACIPGNRDALGENLVIDAESWICGDVTVYAGNLSVLGRVDGDVRAIGGNITVAGQVNGSVTSVGGDVDLQPGARIGGNVQSLGGTVSQNTNVAVRGTIATGSDALQHDTPTHALDPYSAEIPWFQLLFWGLAGAALSLLFPQYVLRVRTMAQRQFAASFVSGVLALIVTVLAVVALLITLIGIPLALLLVAIFWLACVIGNVSLGSWLGGTLLHVVARDRRAVALSTIAGVLSLAALEALPYVGWPLFGLAGLLGLGAVLRSSLAARRGRRELRRAT